MNRPPIRVQITGHEEPAFVVEVALTAVGPPLFRFIDASMETLRNSTDQRSRDASAGWRTRRDAREADPKATPEDARWLLLTELQRNWAYLTPHFNYETVRPPWDPDGLLKALQQASGYVNRSKHNTPLTTSEAVAVMFVLEALMGLIGDTVTADYLRDPLTALKATERRERGAAPAPRPRPVRRKDTVCVGVHWVEPWDTVPGSWWRVAIQDGAVTQCEVELTSDEIVDGLAAAAAVRPVLAGLAFCFSAPEWYIAKHYDNDPRLFWNRCVTFSNRDVAQYVAELGPPFELTGRERTPDIDAQYFRATERQAHHLDATPASIFQVGHEGSVGALALNGIPILPRIRSEKMAIWPFDDPLTDHGTCVEIFPRVLWAVLNPSVDPRSKKNQQRRKAFVESCVAGGLSIPREKDEKRIVREERAFDAFLTAWALWQYGGGLRAVPPEGPERIEGRIWWPT